VYRPREFKQVDVFASAPFLGNPLAAVVDGTDLPAELMQRFARWTNLSETVFLLPPSSPDAGYAVRIFTPFQELPFAGHPTLGAARAWLDSGGTPRARGRIVQECGAGLVPIVCDGADLAFQAPATRRSGPIEEDRLAEIAAALGVDAGRILDHQWVDDGPGWAAVEVSSAEEVLALEPDFSGLPEAMVGVVGARGRRGPGEAAYEVRAFAPGPAWPRTR
jgi:phenazine biosynthesis protein PhzF family protein